MAGGVEESNEYVFQRKLRGLDGDITNTGTQVNFRTRQGDAFQLDMKALPTPSKEGGEGGEGDKKVYSPAWGDDALPEGTNMVVAMVNGKEVTYLTDGGGGGGGGLGMGMGGGVGYGEDEGLVDMLLEEGPVGGLVTETGVHGNALYVAGVTAHPRVANKRKEQHHPEGEGGEEGMDVEVITKRQKPL